LRSWVNYSVEKAKTGLLKIIPIGNRVSFFFAKCSNFSIQQDDHRAFRRQLEDKRPVVENSLLSGRQYVANEQQLSDTSDTEGKRLICLPVKKTMYCQPN
jgi:hypothetical protein